MCLISIEVFLPDKYKTIKPAKFGGQAGGRKYLHNGILYKVRLFSFLLLLPPNLFPFSSPQIGKEFTAVTKPP